MSKLEQRARDAAYQIIDAANEGKRAIDKQDIEEEIVRISKEFAAEACRQLMDCTEILPSRYETVIAEAIAAAEKG